MVLPSASMTATWLSGGFKSKIYITQVATYRTAIGPLPPPWGRVRERGQLAAKG